MKPSTIDRYARAFIEDDAPTLATLEALDVDEWQAEAETFFEEDEVEAIYARVVAILSETP